jgi:hypothetical protein
MKIDMWEWSRWKHPRTAQFLDHLVKLDFADRYDALCRRHLTRGIMMPVAARKAAIASLDRPMYWSKVWRRYMWREAWRVPSGLPKYVAIGLDIKIDDRVELELVFCTPDGAFAGPFTRYLKQIRKMTNPEYSHNNPAPRVSSAEELPIILAESLELYDDIAKSLKSDSWWEFTPKPWLYDKAAQKPSELKEAA